MSSIIHPRAHKLAHEFINEHWHQLPREEGDDREEHEFRLESYIVIVGNRLPTMALNGLSLLREVRRRASLYYHNDCSLPTHSPGRRLDLIQAIGYALLDYMNTPEGDINLFETWYDLVYAGLRYEAKNDRSAVRRP